MGKQRELEVLLQPKLTGLSHAGWHVKYNRAEVSIHDHSDKGRPLIAYSLCLMKLVGSKSDEWFVKNNISKEVAQFQDLESAFENFILEAAILMPQNPNGAIVKTSV